MTAAAISLVIGFSAAGSATGSGIVEAAKLIGDAAGSGAKVAAGVATTKGAGLTDKIDFAEIAATGSSSAGAGAGITTLIRDFLPFFFANNFAYRELTPDVEASSEGVAIAADSATGAVADAP